MVLRGGWVDGWISAGGGGTVAVVVCGGWKQTEKREERCQDCAQPEDSEAAAPAAGEVVPDCW